MARQRTPAEVGVDVLLQRRPPKKLGRSARSRREVAGVHRNLKNTEAEDLSLTMTAWWRPRGGGVGEMEEGEELFL